jgi:octanoyl-[GcvH]:protein N-octanoyltransferase
MTRTAVLPDHPPVRIGAPAAISAEAEMTATRDLLASVSAGLTGPVLRLYRPVPTVAFGRREVHRSGYPAAVEAARAHGFEPVVRNAGGQAVAYGDGSLVVELLAPDPAPAAGLHDRFTAFAGALVAALRSLGVDASTGRLDGEYCPGDHSVVAGGLKLAGTAQRMVARAWLCSASVVVTGAEPLRAVLVDVNRHLEFGWRPATMGAVTDLNAAVTVAEVETAVVRAFGGVAAAGDRTGGAA